MFRYLSTFPPELCLFDQCYQFSNTQIRFDSRLKAEREKRTTFRQQHSATKPLPSVAISTQETS